MKRGHSSGGRPIMDFRSEILIQFAGPPRVANQILRRRPSRPAFIERPQEAGSSSSSSRPKTRSPKSWVGHHVSGWPKFREADHEHRGRCRAATACWRCAWRAVIHEDDLDVRRDLPSRARSPVELQHVRPDMYIVVTIERRTSIHPQSTPVGYLLGIIRGAEWRPRFWIV